MTSYNCEDIYKYYKREGGKLPYRVFKDIIAESNKRISALVINIGYEYYLPHFLGRIRVVKNNRTIRITNNDTIRGAVNWGESKKLKERLLLEGKILYECVKNEEGKIISDNGGDKWLVYFTDKHYYRIGWTDDILLHNCTKYKFIPTWTNARALVASITEDSDIIYRERKNNGTSKYDFLKKCLTKGRTDVRP